MKTLMTISAANHPPPNKRKNKSHPKDQRTTNEQAFRHQPSTPTIFIFFFDFFLFTRTLQQRLLPPFTPWWWWQLHAERKIVLWQTIIIFIIKSVRQRQLCTTVATGCQAAHFFLQNSTKNKLLRLYYVNCDENSGRCRFWRFVFVSLWSLSQARRRRRT